MREILKRCKLRCKCEVCEGHRQLRSVIRRGDKKEMRKCIRDLSEILCNISEELAMAETHIQDLRGEISK